MKNETVGDTQVRLVQEWVNSEYGSVLEACGYGLVVVDGKTGWDVIYGLVIGLQVELGIKNVAPSFGPTTIRVLNEYGPISAKGNNSNSNINKIIKGGCWCTGYNPGNSSGVFDIKLTGAIGLLQKNLTGFAGDGIVDTKIMKALLSMNAYVEISEDLTIIREFQQWLNKTYINRKDYYYIPCDGLYNRDTQEGLVYAIQYECGLDSVANGWFGPTTQRYLKDQGIVNYGMSDGNKNFVKIFKGAFACNNRLTNIDFNSHFDIVLREEVKKFQSFIAIPESGNGDFATWCDCIISCGDTTRTTKALDCSMNKITKERAQIFKDQGYECIGRYLSNKGGSLDKKLEQWEIKNIFALEMKIFPIYQTFHDDKEHFTYENGKEDGFDAIDICLNEFHIPAKTVIYFPVDYDAYGDKDIKAITAYFTGVVESFKATNTYRVGIYGTRNICSIIYDADLSAQSFVAGMSTGFSGNLGFPLPKNWAFNQIVEDDSLGIDHDVKSNNTSLDYGFSYVEKVEDLNVRFIEHLEDIRGHAIKFKAISGCTDTIDHLITDYYRLPDYNDMKWINILGGVNIAWKKYLKEVAKIDFSSGTNRVLNKYNPHTNVYYGVCHMFATVQFYQKFDFFYNDVSKKTFISYPDFGGWAGDFITLYADYYGKYKNKYSVEDYIEKFCGGIGIEQSSYSIEDYYADVDAANIGLKYFTGEKGDQLTLIIREYFNVINDSKFIFKTFYDKRFESDIIMKIVINNLIMRNDGNEVKQGDINNLFKFQANTLNNIENAFTDDIKTKFIDEYIKNLNNRK